MTVIGAIATGVLAFAVAFALNDWGTATFGVGWFAVCAAMGVVIGASVARLTKV
jgi:type IV secretory pathway TrbD component